jgi:hypothetical protein
MDGSSPIVVVMSIMSLLALFTAIAPRFIAGSQSGRSPASGPVSAAGRKARPPQPGVHEAVPVEYLYVPCVRTRDNGYFAETHRWVQEVSIVRKTAKWIYHGSDSWDRNGAVVGPGCISRGEFEAAGVIPIPGDCQRPGPAGRRFFATREAAEADLHRGEREPAEQAAREVPPIKELRRAMVDAHPDRGGTAERFIETHRQYETALRHG